MYKRIDTHDISKIDEYFYSWKELCFIIIGNKKISKIETNVIFWKHVLVKIVMPDVFHWDFLLTYWGNGWLYL
jgi:hypothetical protein